MRPFKFFQQDPHKNKCKLQIGSSFIFHGYYCIVTKMYPNHFEYYIQETQMTIAMSYKFYLQTPSATGRRLNNR